LHADENKERLKESFKAEIEHDDSLLKTEWIAKRREEAEAREVARMTTMQKIMNFFHIKK
jgi:hypothetical protein